MWHMGSCQGRPPELLSGQRPTQPRAAWRSLNLSFGDKVVVSCWGAPRRSVVLWWALPPMHPCQCGSQPLFVRRPPSFITRAGRRKRNLPKHSPSEPLWEPMSTMHFTGDLIQPISHCPQSEESRDPSAMVCPGPNLPGHGEAVQEPPGAQCLAHFSLFPHTQAVTSVSSKTNLDSGRPLFRVQLHHIR
jgi:hypothetical protein